MKNPVLTNPGPIDDNLGESAPATNLYRGVLFDERQPECIDFAPPPPPALLPYDACHYVEVRPRDDEDGEPLVILKCTCGWDAVITDIMGGDDFIAPWEILELAKLHYLALDEGHSMSVSEIERYGLDRTEFEARGVDIVEV